MWVLSEGMLGGNFRGYFTFLQHHSFKIIVTIRVLKNLTLLLLPLMNVAFFQELTLIMPLGQ